MYFKILSLYVILVAGKSICDERRAVSFVPEVADHILQSVKQCMEEYDNDPKAVELIRQGGYGVDDSFKKFVHCCYYRSGYADENGQIFVEKAIKALPKDAHVEEVTKRCSELKGINPVETTYEFFKCFELNSPVRYALK